MINMKLSLQSLALALGLVFSSPAAPQVWTQGMVDCGLWRDARKKDSAAVLEGYLVGLINGMAVASQTEIWKAKGISVTESQVYYWMDGFCEKNPLKDVIQGAFEFKRERTKK